MSSTTPDVLCSSPPAPGLPHRLAVAASSPATVSPPPPGQGSGDTHPSHHRYPGSHRTSLSRTVANDQVRTPDRAKRVPSTPALDEIRDAATKDALREEQAERDQHSPTAARSTAPSTTAAPRPLQSFRPDMISSQRSTATRVDPARPSGATHRHVSADSDVSTISTSTISSQRPTANGGVRGSHDHGAPDVAGLIAAAGSAEAAIQKLVKEKEHSDRQQAQLWRLVEKQRAMILGLNRDLEKSLKEKERYRRKLKESAQLSETAPALATMSRQRMEPGEREDGQSLALLAERNSGSAVTSATSRDFSLDSRKVSDSSELTSAGPSRSDTPQDVLTSGAGSAVPPSIATTQPLTEAAEGPSTSSRLDTMAAQPTSTRHAPAEDAQISPKGMGPASSSHTTAPGQHHKSASSTFAISPPSTAQSFSSPKQATRKAPPAPLQLSPLPGAMTNHIVDASDSEYEDDPDSARAEQTTRGRRKTREDDDREREAAAREELEHRSRSKKDKSSKSKSKPPADSADTRVGAAGPAADPPQAVYEQKTTAPAYQMMVDPAALLRQRAIADNIGNGQPAPALMSPGLPMSPRPGDRPMNSPMPRAPNKILNSIPMSPKAGMAGLPLSPRAPRQPIPLPPQTPLAATLNNPHLARAEMYQTSIANRLKASPEPSPDQERPSMSSEPRSPMEVYTGFVTEQYPDLLLPPNALPSIYVKTYSPRMRPSRQSYIAPKSTTSTPVMTDENPVITLAVHQRSGHKQLWCMEKTYAALATFDTRVRSVSTFRDRLPDRSVFAGHAPSKVDARRAAMDVYLDRMLECIMDENAANIVCKFLSCDVLGTDAGNDYLRASADLRPDTPLSKQRPHRAGFLTKRGKNFGGWKARYFVLDGPILRYFEAPGGAHLGVIRLQNAQIGKQSPNSSQPAHDDEDNQFRHAFLVLEPKKKDSSSLVRHVLCAESDEERDLWVDALLAYVDYQDGDDDSASSTKGTQVTQPHISAARSPRLKQSFGDLRPSNLKIDRPDQTRGVSYNDTVAGEAPVIGTAPGSPSLPQEATFPSPPSRPLISGPSDLTVIKNGDDWKGKAQPTPLTATFPKDQQKKRGFFASTFTSGRGRSSSDLKEQISPPAQQSHDHNINHGHRAVFGVPLAEAVEHARPVDVATELPAVVYRCFEYLTVKHAIAEEGIFRLSGSNTVIRSLKDRFNAEGDVNLVADETYYDIHAVASLLKTYLRELPASILTRELHLEFLSCLEMNAKDKIAALNGLVNRLPMANRALLEALSAFLLSVVSNADVNKMNVRNVGIVFAPTLNVPGPLISSFVEDQHVIFGLPMDEAESPISAREARAPALPSDLRSPRKQMFSDLPTPAYNQTTFQSFGAVSGNETGFTPMQPSYANYQMAPQGDGGYGSLNDALRSPTMYNSATGGTPTSRDVKSRRRESAMMLQSLDSSLPKQPSLSDLREEEATKF
nr:putative rho-type gtpase-activating protein 2 [Quercus suber]